MGYLRVVALILPLLTLTACSSLQVADLDSSTPLPQGSGSFSLAVAIDSSVKDDTYDSDIESRAIANVAKCITSQKSWDDLDRLVAVLKQRYPVLQPLKL